MNPALMCCLYINSHKYNKRQQLIDPELVKTTEKLNYKSSYFLYKEKDNSKVMSFAVLELLTLNSGEEFGQKCDAFI